MGIKVYWHDPEKTIVVFEFGEEWTWDDFYAAAAEEEALLDTIDHKVSVIFYSLTSLVKIPDNALNHLRKLVNMAHPKEDLLVVVSGPPLLHSLMDVLKRVYRLNRFLANYIYVDTLQEALDAIQARRIAT